MHSAFVWALLGTFYPTNYYFVKRIGVKKLNHNNLPDAGCWPALLFNIIFLVS